MIRIDSHDIKSQNHSHSCDATILASQHTNTMTTHPFTCDDDILAFEHASIAFECNRKRITINRCVVQLNKQSNFD